MIQNGPHQNGQDKGDPRFKRLIQICTNITEAHSCFLILPEENVYELTAWHSISSDLAPAKHLSRNQSVLTKGLIGWIAEQGKPLCASPFEGKAYENLFYRSEQGLKSLLGVPVPLANGKNGVLACDSKNPYAFNNLHLKIVHDIALEIATIVEQGNTSSTTSEQNTTTFANFFERATSLVHELGGQSVEVLRLNCLNLSDLERDLGVEKASLQFDQFARLVDQALPNHFPSLVLPGGDIVIVLDRMVGKFYENRLMALCDYLSKESGKGLIFLPVRKSSRRLRANRSGIDLLIVEAGLLPHQRSYTENTERSNYEYRSA